MIKRYETLVLMRTGTTKDELERLEKGFQDAVSSHGGSITSVDHWGKYELAQPILKEKYGIYALVRYTAPSREVKKIETKLAMLFRATLPEVVMRHINVCLRKDAPSTYARPSSIEEAGSASVDTLMKDGFLSSPRPGRSAPREQAQVDEEMA